MRSCAPAQPRSRAAPRSPMASPDDPLRTGKLKPRPALTWNRKRGPRARGVWGPSLPRPLGHQDHPRHRTAPHPGPPGVPPASGGASPHRWAPPCARANVPLPSSPAMAPPLLFWTWDPRWKLVPQTSLAARSAGRDSLFFHPGSSSLHIHMPSASLSSPHCHFY